jgi:Heterokaryon incompatibility protein (HET)
MAAYIGIRYMGIWIDSLCIIQDFMTDCEREAASMASIDSNAILTFSATAAGDGSGGCIFDYDSTLSIQRSQIRRWYD